MNGAIEKEENLLTEGDVNFAASRKNWYKILDETTFADLLDQENRLIRNPAGLDFNI